MDASVPRTSVFGPPQSAAGRRPSAIPADLWRAVGAAASVIYLGLSLRLALRIDVGPAPLETLQALLFGPLAGLTAAVSSGLALAMFLEIVRAYRKRLGFPWFPSLCFSSSALACLLALHACVS